MTIRRDPRRLPDLLFWRPEDERPVAAGELFCYAVALVVGGLVTLLLVTLLPAESRGLAITGLAVAVSVVIGTRRPIQTALLFVSLLVLSDHEPNQVADFLARDQFGSIWATSIAGRFVAAEAVVALAIGLGVLGFVRSGAQLRVTAVDRLIVMLAVLLGVAAALGAVGREPAEEWRFWFFDARAALYLLMGALLGRLLIVSDRPQQLVQITLWSVAVVFVLTAIRFSLTPTGYKTIGDTDVVLVSELVFLSAVFVLMGGIYALWQRWPGLIAWSAVASFMTLIVFLSGRRTALLLMVIAVVVLLLIAGKGALRLAAALAISVVAVTGLANVVAPRPMSAAVLGVVETVRSGEAVFTSAAATASAAATTSSGDRSPQPTVLPTPTTSVAAPSAPPISEAATVGTETRLGEVRNVYKTMAERGGLLTGLGFGKLWRIYYPQPVDPFAVGPRSGLLGTDFRFNTHVPGLDYFQRFGFIGVTAWVVWAVTMFAVLRRWPTGKTRTSALALAASALIAISLWGDPRMFFVGGLLLGTVGVLEARLQSELPRFVRVPVKGSILNEGEQELPS